MGEIINYYKGKEKIDVSLESLQDEIAQCLQMDNLCFLVGAGCSSNVVDEKETGIPGMKKLCESFFEKNSGFEIAGKNMRDRCDNNLEKLMEYLNSVKVVNEVVEIDKSVESKTLAVCSFLIEQIKSGQSSKTVQEIYKNFYAKITQKPRKNPISIFTTNYDLFNESALDDLGFPYNNGFTGTYKRKFNPASYNFMYVENMNIQHDVWEQVPSFFNLIKLHGSITWIREGDQIREVDFNKIRPDETVMIYPTPLKDRNTLMTPYSDLFRIMENKLLQKNSVLIVLGYSFSDDHINRIILNALALPSYRLVVFGRGDNIDKLIRLNDSRITVIYSQNNIHYFKNFVEKVLPSIHPDVEETLNLMTRNDI